MRREEPRVISNEFRILSRNAWIPVRVASCPCQSLLMNYSILLISRVNQFQARNDAWMRFITRGVDNSDVREVLLACQQFTPLHPELVTSGRNVGRFADAGIGKSSQTAPNFLQDQG